ncbi:cell division topological specificity factor MinE [Ameyamaea chiangmaiensis NBRC 103196]|uniref:Cell division topological specificity factor n=1 Tax=Ameyamaea chiangmaiensis TaxID=442969 RepID=A0A850PAE1_9PROT|nr:cell division topological specificity factor MinE [Ameyamaea chiangmaiensis]MBS4075833.1 cell division topological specificity factor MinE [Ameyamaea chiangmaiensis]NVN39296.1 cell division topological specificity factor MinE [Ameyamaea chiangmaiensis]GBQ63918.1 cell division topological specificity factor MinE [Ameyamaea chiangmaiensis NBRC 103196]
MSFLANLFAKRNSAPVARDRLQILLAHERSAGEGHSDLLAKLHQEILEVIARHVAVDQDKVQVKLDRGSGCSLLEIDVEVPQLGSAKSRDADKRDA